MRRRTFLSGAFTATIFASGIDMPSAFGKRTLERRDVDIAVGGKSLLYYLPLTIAERRHYFRDEGLAVTISDFAGGSQALKAAVGGSVDVVAGAFEHTLLLQTKHQMFREFVLMGRAPQIVLAVSRKTLPGYRSVADLKGKRIGVTAPGSSTSIMASYVLAKAGLKPEDVAFIGVGSGAGAIGALQSGRIDALVNVDPVITKLARAGDIAIAFDTRTLADTRTVFGGNMPSGCLYASQKFITQNPNTTQALANAIVRALKWLQGASNDALLEAVPSSYLLGDPVLYLACWAHVKEAMSPDGLMPADGPPTSLNALRSFVGTMRDKPVDLSLAWTNSFVDRALATVGH